MKTLVNLIKALLTVTGIFIFTFLIIIIPQLWEWGAFVILVSVFIILVIITYFAFFK